MLRTARRIVATRRKHRLRRPASNDAFMHRDPKSCTARSRSHIKTAVGAVVARHGLEEVIGCFGIGRFGGELSAVAVAREILIEKTRRDLVAENSFDRGATDPHFSSARIGGENDRFVLRPRAERSVGPVAAAWAAYSAPSRIEAC